jgi:nucleoside-diphosphate-sugar epimerase
MRILITGNMGYVGPLIVRQLRKAQPTATLIGADIGFFAHCITGAWSLPESFLDSQLFVDVRDPAPAELVSVDCVVYLAAISNDPMGNSFEKVTYAINHEAAVNYAKRAKAAGVKRFIYASSCSTYGFAGEGARTEGSELNPLTAYAKSKVAAEKDLQPLADEDFQVTCLRFATACGMSDRLRLDLVLNDFVASAVADKKITILSDGTPWRPLIHVADMARAVEWAVTRSNGGDFLTVNVGSDRWNYQVRALAEAVAKALPGTQVSINRDAQPDKRSYRVDFSLFRKLAPNHQPIVELGDAVLELREALTRMRFQDSNFRSSQFMRLNVLTSHLEARRLSSELRWLAP